MICARCDRRISPGQGRLVDNVPPTGPGTTLYIHKVLCVKPPTQTAPAPAIGSRRHR